MPSFSLLFSDYPAWYFIFCLILGVAYAWFLYSDSKAFAKPTRILLFALRGLVITLLAFLLVNPLFQTIKNIIEKPVIVIASDNSSSLLLNKYGNEYKQNLAQQQKTLIAELKKDFDVEEYQFGDQVTKSISNSFIDKKTDFSKLFSTLNSSYANRNVGALIVFSDGIYNEGSNPLYSNNEVNAPIYSIALGDTIPQRDLLISDIQYNKIVYLGNDFTINVSVSASSCTGSTTQLTVLEDGNSIFKKDIAINSGNFRIDVPITLQAKKTGTVKYFVSVSDVKREITLKNNSRAIFPEILDGKQKILFLAAAPHPDISAVRQSLENNKNYEVTIAYPDAFDVNTVNQYNLIIMHQLPTAESNAQVIITKIKESGIPVWYITGSQTYPDLFNRMQSGVTISGSKNQMNELLPELSNDFFLFSLSDQNSILIKSLPPLNGLFGTYSSTTPLSTLLYQKIGSVSTKTPLLAFGTNGNSKTAYLFGEGIWKWRLYNFREKQNHEAVDELINKTVQYMTAKEDKRKFRVSIPKNDFDENENISINAELYNDSYELINTPDAFLEIANKAGKKYPFTFSKTEKAYKLDAGVLPVDEYKYTARTKLGDKSYEVKGQFIIKNLNLEELQTTANHQLLNALSEKSGGKLFYLNQLQQLADLIKNKEEIKTVSFEQKRLDELISLKWIFFLLMTLLSIEWFVRKRSGGY